MNFFNLNPKNLRAHTNSRFKWLREPQCHIHQTISNVCGERQSLAATYGPNGVFIELKTNLFVERTRRCLAAAGPGPSGQVERRAVENASRLILVKCLT